MKYISLLCLLVVLALPVTVEAHTHLESSEPESGGALSSENPGVTLTFDSKVQEPTTLTVTGENGEELQIDNYTHSPDNVIAFNIPEEAAGGDIEVFYSIIGEDGHVMENQLTFQYTVNDKAFEPEASETEEPEAASGEGENAEGEESEDQQVAASEQGNESMVWIVPVLGFGLLITAVLVFLGIRKKS
ncbi:copper resistance CopC family protein [Halobacillus sp. HZG1]|uniref:copper resistance CopC family protein n=1 Tax=Halobacillus sp. HZG1 TaxID=3111769 RepID=UPI002DB566FD|nr:copper resistance CopC family protein [Halobacillus sp. HZG1]MEC3883071.1 copper resistance CopC family protein [Halobacillus sp. HZG1]